MFDNKVWGNVPFINDFVQESPNYFLNPSEKMNVYIAYSSDALFIYAKLFDQEPDKISYQLSDKDDWYGAFDDRSDWFSFEIDSQHDHQTGFSFAVNASGVKCDEMIYNDESYDNDWNAIWDAEVMIDEFGWNVEIEIPFSMLRFNKSEEFIWGMNITRYIKRKDETIKWVVLPVEIDGISSHFGHLVGLKGIYPPARFEFKPFFLFGSTQYSDILLKDINYSDNHIIEEYVNNIYRFGLDMQFRPNTNSVSTFTINPDYGQIELDPQDINLTAYETYFSEKRPFFLENSTLFKTPIEVFYSRRIGQDEFVLEKDRNGQEVWELKENSIKGAGQFTGKSSNGFSYGLIGAITERSNPERSFITDSSKIFSIARIKQDLFQGNSFVGILMTLGNDEHSSNYSIDGLINMYDNTIGIDAQLVFKKNRNEDFNKGIYTSISYNPLGYFSYWIDYQLFDKKFNINDFGYLKRNNFSQIKIATKFENQLPWNRIRNISFIIESVFDKNIDNLDLGKTLELNYFLQTKNFWEINGGMYKMFDHFHDRLTIIDINEYGPAIYIPEINGVHFSILTNFNKNISLSFEKQIAQNSRNDVENKQSWNINYRPNQSFIMSASISNYFLNKKFHYLETISVETDLINSSFLDHHYLFANLEHRRDVWTISTSGNISRNLTIRIYNEIFFSYDQYNEYTEYLEDIDDFVVTDFILGVGEWEGEPAYAIDLSTNPQSLLDPNYYIGFFPNYNSFKLNAVIKWNFSKGSNLYLVFTDSNSINGTQFESFYDYIFTKNIYDWSETLNDKTLMLKVDYWFNK